MYVLLYTLVRVSKLRPVKFQSGHQSYSNSVNNKGFLIKFYYIYIYILHLWYVL
jgi:hypothetical protein